MKNRTRRRKSHWRIKRTPLNQSLVVSIVIIIMILLLNKTILKHNDVERVGNITIKSTIAEGKMVADAQVVAKNEPTELFTDVSRGATLFRFVYNVTLSTELQAYTYELTSKCPDISYELVLALLYTESRFDANATGHNSDGSIDQGIAQINSYYTDHYAQTSGEKDFNPYNPKHGIKACVYKLQMLADVWKKKGITDKDTLELYSIQSYHMSVRGFEKYMATNGEESKYSKLIFDRKMQLLTTKTITE